MQISQAKLNQMLYEAKYGPDWTEHEHNMIDLAERLDEWSYEVMDYYNQYVAGMNEYGHLQHFEYIEDVRVNICNKCHGHYINFGDGLECAACRKRSEPMTIGELMRKMK